MMGWGCWRVLLGGNEVDGDMAAQLDMMVGANGGENGDGQDRDTRVVLRLAARRWWHCGAAAADSRTG
jgi:hypothetical protein